jgi:hypothetical protein
MAKTDGREERQELDSGTFRQGGNSYAPYAETFQVRASGLGIDRRIHIRGDFFGPGGFDGRFFRDKLADFE